MTDRELLKLAAKAAGIDLNGGVDEHGAYEENWNPLTNDGDALRLAVTLRISVEQDFDRIVAYNNGAAATEYIYEKPTPTDRHASTRRAIVRAATEIGKAKP